MNLLRNAKENFKKLFVLRDASDNLITINETLSYANNITKNVIWYRGDALELSQFYKSINTNQTRFWSAVPSHGLEIRRYHSGLPALVINTLKNIIVDSYHGIEINNDDNATQIWSEIEQDNNFVELFEKAIQDTLIQGDGCFKVSFDNTISKYPIVEFVPAAQVDIVRKRGRIVEIVFTNNLQTNNCKDYVLKEKYGYGYIKYELYDTEGHLITSDKIKKELDCDYEDMHFTSDLMLCVPFKFFSSNKFTGRGMSILEGKDESFDGLDEILSQWLDAVRSGRAKTYIPDILIPKNGNGQLLIPNSFDNKFIQVGSDLGEGKENKIQVEQPQIPSENYLESYVTFLDLCLQGIISPSTLGIDTKKLDNAEAQREKEKTTLYTINAINRAIEITLPRVCTLLLSVYAMIYDTNINIDGIDISINLSSYQNPSFESQIETLAKAYQAGIMSIERVIDELYGDKLTKEEKLEEIARIKEMLEKKKEKKEGENQDNSEVIENEDN
jgi:hypothetical protein